MKNLFGLLAVITLLVVLAPTSLAQEPAAESIKVLQDQIRKLELADRDPNTPAEVRKINESFLVKRRSQLQLLLRKQTESLRSYLAKVQDVLSHEEIQQVERTIKELEKQQADLKSDGSEAATTTSDGGASVDTTENSSSGPRASSAPSTNESAAPNSASAASVPPLPAVTDCTSSTSYKDAPPLLTDIVQRVTEDIVDNNKKPLEMVNGSFNKMLFYTVADALTQSTDSPVRSIKSLKAYQYLGETARTDKQVGASSSSSGTTSAIEKPGFASLLGFAVEKGAILKDVNGDALTLSTSPYVLFTLNNGGDTAENYARAGFLNRVGVSATFNIEDQNNVFASARRNQLTEWSVRARLYGDRSTRSKAFQDFWNKPGGPREAIEGRLNALTAAFKFMNDNAADFDAFDAANTQINQAVTALIATDTYTKASPADKKSMLANAILCNIKAGVFDEIRSGKQTISENSRKAIVDTYVPALAAALNNLDVVRSVLKDKLDELAKGPLATFAYINHRDPTNSDYSEFKFLYEQDKTLFHTFKVVGNAGLTMYNKPNPLLKQTRFRDFSAALSFEGAFDSPFLKNQPDLSKITYAFTGNYQRMRENQGVPGRKADLAAFQFKLDIPIYAGFGLPLAITYSNGTEHTKKEDTRFNFGLKFDMDKLMALTKLLGKP